MFFIERKTIIVASIEGKALNSSIISNQSNLSRSTETNRASETLGQFQDMEVKKTSAWGTAGRILLGIVTLGASEGIRAYYVSRSSQPPQARASQLDQIARNGLGGVSLDQNRSERLRKLDAMSDREIAKLSDETIAAMSDDEKAAIGKLFGNKDKLSFGDFAGQRIDVWLLNLKRQRGEDIHPPAVQPPKQEPQPNSKSVKSLQPDSIDDAQDTKAASKPSNPAFDNSMKLALEKARKDLQAGQLDEARKGCEEAIARLSEAIGKSDSRIWDFKQILAESYAAEGDQLSMINTLSDMTDFVETNIGKPGNAERAGYTFLAWANYSKQNGHIKQYEKYTQLALQSLEVDLNEREGGDVQRTKTAVASLKHRVANQLAQKGDFTSAIRQADDAYKLRLEEYGQFDERTIRSSKLLSDLKKAKMDAFLAEPDDPSVDDALL